jgi:hypothetical protein
VQPPSAGNVVPFHGSAATPSLRTSRGLNRLRGPNPHRRCGARCRRRLLFRHLEEGARRDWGGRVTTKRRAPLSLTIINRGLHRQTDPMARYGFLSKDRWWGWRRTRTEPILAGNHSASPVSGVRSTH